jgi:hypothetical protein
MGDWRGALRADPLDWLLEPSDPAVRHLALVDLLDEPPDAPAVVRARRAAMRADPIAAIVTAQHPDGYWQKPGAGYAKKYTGTVWSLTFLDQMGADPADRRIQRACDYVLAHSAATTGGFAASRSQVDRPPPPSEVIHCLNGNLVRALIGFGYLDDDRVRRAIEWEARSITGEGFEDAGFRYYRSGTSGPGFRCAFNWQLPCAWGDVKAMRALTRIPPRRRTRAVKAAIDDGVAFLLSVDPATAAYPTGSNVSPSWFRLGFPSGYVADVLQILETLAELGHARDPRLANTLELVLSKQDDAGRWRNEYPYRGKLWAEVDEPRTPSKWVTLRACRVLKASVG